MRELTILLPCLNEAETLAACIARARRLIEENGLDAEILVSDNGSTDGSQEIARGLGARVVDCPVRGYGAALQHGIERAEGEFVLMGDSDDSYHFDEAMPLIARLREGCDVCMGTRLRGRIMPGAMPFLNRYVGNPVLTGVGRVLFGLAVTDFHSGMRAFRRGSILGLGLVTTGMEWASEMVIKARMGGLRIVEEPITLHRDGRSRRPHLRRWRDGWRHLRFMLLHAPNWLFLLPGMALVAAGVVGIAVVSAGALARFPSLLEVPAQLLGAFAVLTGMQTVFTGIFANFYAHIVGILPADERFMRLIKKLSLERLLLISVGIGLIGLAGVACAACWWLGGRGSPDLVRGVIRLVIPCAAMIALAVQGIFNGFMLSILFLKTRGIRESEFLRVIELEERGEPDRSA